MYSIVGSIMIVILVSDSTHCVLDSTKLSFQMLGFPLYRRCQLIEH